MKERKDLHDGPETSLGPHSLHICGPSDVRRVSWAFFFASSSPLVGDGVAATTAVAVAAAAEAGNRVT